MEEREFYARMDRRQESSDALLVEIREDVRLTRAAVELSREEAERSREQIELSREEAERSREQIELSREEAERSREEVRLSREQRERSDQVLVRNGEALDRNGEALDRNAEIHSDLRVFMRDMVTRFDRITREQIRAWQEQVVEIRGLSRTVERQIEELGAELRDLREESRAQRSALLRLIDRFDGPQPGGASSPA